VCPEAMMDDDSFLPSYLAILMPMTYSSQLLTRAVQGVGALVCTLSLQRLGQQGAWDRCDTGFKQKSNKAP